MIGYEYNLMVMDEHVIKNRHGFVDDHKFSTGLGYVDLHFIDPEDRTVYLQTHREVIDWSLLNNEPTITDKLKSLLTNWI